VITTAAPSAGQRRRGPAAARHTGVMRTRPAVLCPALLCAALLCAGCSTTTRNAPPPTTTPAPVTAPATAPDRGLPDRLVAEVSGDAALRHLQELQRIADANGGNRALGRPGYDASVDYVAGALRAAGYQVQTPEFTARRFTVRQQRLTVAGAEVAAVAFGYSPATPAGGLSGPLATVDGEACDAGALAGVPRGSVLVVRRGTCTFAQKSAAAAGAGAQALLVVNNEKGALTGGTLGDTATGTVPTAGLSRADGDPLFARAGAPVSLVLDTAVDQVRSRNVIAQTSTGDPDRVVVAGAHLDSVPEGPGINDNGSGTAALLEIAVRLGSAPPVANAVRFAFWGAEEEGLVGSDAYVTGLGPQDRKRIAVYLNLDMVGSPNSGYFVLDGDGSEPGAGEPAPAGSAAVEKALVDALAATGVPVRGTGLDGNSDYAPFAAAGIPTGGLFTGASEPMTPAEAQLWGGRPNAPHDPCYHQACDRVDTIDRTALDRNADATARVIGRYALSVADLGR
jgi:Zn-dependent M28 family amino/carboxypeptidase